MAKACCILGNVDLVGLTRQLVDIESISGNEARVGDFLHGLLVEKKYAAKKIPVEGERFNLLAVPRDASPPQLVLSTHMDVVPPFFSSWEDADNIYGRGACDAKGIIAAQIAAAEQLRGDLPIGLLFLVGEERDSKGAHVANRQARELCPEPCRFLINGEPTENCVATASKGALRVEVTAHGRMAHSAYPNFGDSAIDKLIIALERLRAMPLPQSRDFGPCTMNIGVIEGGRAPNVIADHARAQLLYRLIGPADELKKQIVETVAGIAGVEFVLEIPFVKLRTVNGLPTMIAAFTTDIPALSNWGEPVMLGPGSITVAHTEREFVSKKDLHAAVDLYCNVARKLMG